MITLVYLQDKILSIYLTEYVNTNYLNKFERYFTLVESSNSILLKRTNIVEIIFSDLICGIKRSKELSF